MTMRSMVERTINRLKRYRRIATRFEKLACSYSAMIAVACFWNGCDFADGP